MLRVCVEAGGTISGEHGIGFEKNNYMPWIFNEADLEAMRRVKAVFDPAGHMNPWKIFPTPVSYSEVLGVAFVRSIANAGRRAEMRQGVGARARTLERRP